MTGANCPITAALISDYAAGRLDPEDARVIEEAIGRDEAIADAVAAARKVNSRMTASLARPVETETAITRQRRKKLRAWVSSVPLCHLADRGLMSNDYI
jgi:anti-sigma factor RsiW